MHCHNHANIDISSLVSSGATGTVYDETEIKRQNIMLQICEAKKRQA